MMFPAHNFIYKTYVYIQLTHSIKTPPKIHHKNFYTLFFNYFIKTTWNITTYYNSEMF
jgi:hypothetical protein